MWFSISVCLQLVTNYEEFIRKYLLPGIQRCIHKSVSGQEEPSEYEADDVYDQDDHDDEEEVEELWGVLESKIRLTIEAGGREAVVPGHVGQGEVAGAEGVQQNDG